MRALSLPLALLLAACTPGPASDGSSTSDGPSPTSGSDGGSSCPSTCAACPTGEDCVASGTVAAACYPRCHTGDDCAAGLACVGLDVTDATDLQKDDMQARHCLPANAPACPGAPPPGGISDGQHCDFTDANAFASSFTSSFGGAFQYVRCAHGCGFGDGGLDVGCNP